MAINWIDSGGSNRRATGHSHPDAVALSTYLENIFLENQSFTERQRRLEAREEFERELGERSDHRRGNSRGMDAEGRNKIVKEYNEKERKKREEEFEKLKKVAKDKGLDSPIGSLEV